MKVLLIYNRYKFRGGEDTYVDSLAKLLKEDGHVVIAYYKDSRSIHSFWGKFIAAIGLFWNFSTAREINDIVEKHKPDVAHIHNIYPLISPTIYYVLKKRGIRMIQTIHNYKFMCPKNSLFRSGKVCELCINKTFFYPSILFSCYHDSRLASFIYSLSFFLHRFIGAFERVDTYVFPSSFTRNYYLRYAHIHPKKAVLLPHFINDVSIIKKPSSKYFLYLGRITEEKGVDTLLNTFSRIPHKKLIMIGDGNLRDQLMKKYLPYKNIIFRKQMGHTLAISHIQNATAVIVPSIWYEVLPMVILEAIMYDKPLLIRQTKNSKVLFSGIAGIDLYKEGELGKRLNGTRYDNKKVDYKEIKKTMNPKFHLRSLLKIYSPNE